MKKSRRRNHEARIRDLVSRLEPRPLPLVREDTPLEEAVRSMARSLHSRLLYVVDADGRLLGSVSAASLVHHLFAGARDPSVHARSLIGMIVNETVGHIMQRNCLSVSEDETVDQLLRRSVAADVSEIPILDAAGRVVADVRLVDLLDFLLQEADS